MDREALEKRKKIVYEFICDDLYVPMKAKEIAMILQVSKEQREELHAVLDALLEEGKVELTLVLGEDGDAGGARRIQRGSGDRVGDRGANTVGESHGDGVLGV